MRRMRLFFLLAIGFFYGVCLSASHAAGELTLLPSQSGLGVGKQLQMVFGLVQGTDVYSIVPQATSTTTVKWSSSNSLIASVDQDGKVIGKRPGTVDITATVTPVGHGITKRFNSRITVVNVPVDKLQGPEKISVYQYCSVPIVEWPKAGDGSDLNDRLVYWANQSPQFVSLGSQHYLHPIPLPSVKSPIYSSLDFHRTAEVTGIKTGNALIAASCEGVTKKISVEVASGDPTSVQINSSSNTLTIGQSYPFHATAKNGGGCNVPNVSFTWSVANQFIAKVNPSTGVVTPLNPGTTQISAMTANGISDSATVNVVCTAGLTDCGGSCKNLSTDLQNCGACGYNISPLNCCSGIAADLLNDPNHCGGCNTSCGGGRICNNGRCACPAGETVCDDTCTDTQTDTKHCGGCDKTECWGYCVNGKCVSTPGGSGGSRVETCHGINTCAGLIGYDANGNPFDYCSGRSGCYEDNGQCLTNPTSSQYSQFHQCSEYPKDECGVLAPYYSLGCVWN